MNNYRNTPLQGFTLIELLIAISIIGITMGIAVPSFITTIASNRLTTSANNLVSALQLAKSEAIKSNFLVVVSPIGSWANGWIVFADVNNTGAQEAGETTISSFGAVATGFTIKPYANSVTYRPDGRTTTFGNFVFCSPSNTSDFRRVDISATGRVQVKTPASLGITYAAAGCP